MTAFPLVTVLNTVNVPLTVTFLVLTGVAVTVTVAYAVLLTVVCVFCTAVLHDGFARMQSQIVFAVALALALPVASAAAAFRREESDFLALGERERLARLASRLASSEESARGPAKRFCAPAAGVVVAAAGVVVGAPVVPKPPGAEVWL